MTEQLSCLHKTYLRAENIKKINKLETEVNRKFQVMCSKSSPFYFINLTAAPPLISQSLPHLLLTNYLPLTPPATYIHINVFASSPSAYLLMHVLLTNQSACLSTFYLLFKVPTSSHSTDFYWPVTSSTFSSLINPLASSHSINYLSLPPPSLILHLRLLLAN